MKATSKRRFLFLTIITFFVFSFVGKAQQQKTVDNELPIQVIKEKGKNNIILNVSRYQSSDDKIQLLLLGIKEALHYRRTRLDTVFISYKGNKRMYIDGKYFQELGNAHNVLDFLNTYPDHIYNMDGTKAFRKKDFDIKKIVKDELHMSYKQLSDMVSLYTEKLKWLF